MTTEKHKQCELCVPYRKGGDETNKNPTKYLLYSVIYNDKKIGLLK